MKKVLVTFILAALIIASFCRCSNSTPETNASVEDTSIIDTSVSDTTSEETSSDEIDYSIFPEVEATSKSSHVYREEVLKRLNSLEEGESFFTEEEWHAIESSGFFTETKFRHSTYITGFHKLFKETSEYYYPVVFKDGNLLYVWYTTESGSINFERIHGHGFVSGNHGGYAHRDSFLEEISITRDQTKEVTYNQGTGIVSMWAFGKVVETYSVPEGSVYCGISTFEGIIFRDGTDILTLNSKKEFNEEKDEWETIVFTSCIAHDVKYVIDADYRYASDPWSQPLFIMTDGSIKCYISWEGNKDIPDDPSHLVDLKYEGSYDK